MLYSNKVNPVMLPPGRAKLSTIAGADGVGDQVNTIGTVRVACCDATTEWSPLARMTSGREFDQFRRVLTSTLGIAGTPALVDPHVAALGPAQLLQTLHERRQTGLSFQTVGRRLMSTPIAAHPGLLLRARRERPCRRAAEQRDELAAPCMSGKQHSEG